MIETNASWVVQSQFLNSQGKTQWKNWGRYTAEQKAQVEFARLRRTSPEAKCRIVKETWTLEAVEPNAALVEK